MASFATNDIHVYCKAIRVTDGSSVTLMKEGEGDNLTRTVLKYNFHLFSAGNALFLALDKN